MTQDPTKLLSSIAKKHYKSKKGKSNIGASGTRPRQPKLKVKNLSDDELKAVYDQIIIDRELVSRSFRNYAKLCWPKLEPGKPYITTAWHSDCLSDHMQALVEGEIRRLLISIPPGYGKSTWACVFMPSYSWIKRPWTQLLFGSYNLGFSHRDAGKFRDLIRSSWWQNRWGDGFKLTKHNLGEIRNDMGGSRLVSSIGGSTIGFRADIAVADDPLNILEPESEVARKAAIDWWTGGMRTRGDKDLRELVIMQRLHDNDLIGYLSAEVGGYEILKLPAEYIPQRSCVTFRHDGTKFWEDPRKEEGELLFEEKFDRTFLDDRRGSELFSAMQQQEPVKPGGNIIKTKWFRFYQCSPEEMYSKCSWAVLSCDTAVKAKDTSTWTVLQIWGVSGPNIYLIDQRRDQLDTTGIIKAIEGIVNKWNALTGPGVQAKIIEDKATGPAVLDTLKMKFPGLIPFPSDDDKTDRMRAITWLWEAGNVYVPGKPARPEAPGKPDFSHVPWMDGEDGWYREVTRFPKARFNDQAITMSQALMYIAQKLKVSFGLPIGIPGPGVISRLREMTQY